MVKQKINLFSDKSNLYNLTCKTNRKECQVFSAINLTYQSIVAQLNNESTTIYMHTCLNVTHHIHIVTMSYITINEIDPSTLKLSFDTELQT